MPEHGMDQEVVAEQARRLFAHRMPEYERIAGVFGSTGIRRRYSVRPIEWFLRTQGWPERTAAYIEGARELYERVVREALDKANISPADVDVVATISSTGIATPSLEARVLPHMGFRAHTQRVPVFGLGCAGGVSGLALGARLACAQAGAVVLVVALELCTLAFRLDRPTKVDLIATSLFGDGAAAAVLTTDASRPVLAKIVGAAEHLWPKTLDIMGWSMDDIGFGVVLSRSLPAFVAKNYRDVLDAARRRMGLADLPLGSLVCHPGGAKVLDAVEALLGMERGTLRHERSVLRDFGNMSSPTVFFVLERALRAGLEPHALLCALGPGFTASFAALAAPA